MKIYFSKTTSGFYTDDVNAALPADAVEITADQHAAMLAAQSSGKLISADGNGAPVAIDRPAPAIGVVRATLLPELRSRRDLAMNILDGLQADALTAADSATASAIRTAKQACRDLPALDVTAATDEAGIRALYLAEWRRIATLVPPSVRIAFAAVLA